ncbi:MAG TPA: extracellular solute-binding protein [Streptosporangiaceae bacterium]|nr:extracellular solute-binding protein [Streptosporangiaceae bacterium]
MAAIPRKSARKYTGPQVSATAGGRLRWRHSLLVIVCAGLAAAGCSSSAGSSASAQGAAVTGTAVTGTASVAYASSLQFLNEKVAGPAFTRAGGYTYSGRGASSGELESEIAGKEITPNVFESVGGDNITPLEPAFTRWYVQYAGTQIVVAYNPKSKYASQFKALADGKESLKSLFTLMETPGFKLGRTDPNIDPQGRDFIYMLELAQSYYHLPGDAVTRILGGPAGSSSSAQIYAESSLDATLQSGQLDASSAFISQAVQLHLPYIKLPAAINLGDASLAAQYAKATVTITPPGGARSVKKGSPQVIDITIIGKPTPAGIAFVKYTLSAAGLAQYKQGGFTLLTPTVTGDSSAVPAAVKSELGG